MESLIGLHGFSGYECELQSAMLNHGATDSSNQWVTSFPGVDTVGICDGSRGSCSFHVTSFPDPCRLEMNLMIGSSWPT